MTEYEKWTLFLQGAAVFATLVIAALAIWGEKIRQIWNKPQLKLHLDAPSLTRTSGGQRGWYYLIKVRNQKASSPAKNVRILLTNILKKGPDGSWIEQRFSGPTQVTWRWPDLMPLYATIGPQENSSFGYLLENSRAFRLQLYWYPNNLTAEIPPNDPTRLKFKAVSDTAQSNVLTIELAWDGQWVEGSAEMRDHLAVKEISA